MQKEFEDQFIVADCSAKAAGPKEVFRGRSNRTNGSAHTIIWKIGTHRIVSWAAASRSAYDVIYPKMTFSMTLFATFTAYPMKKDIPGHRLPYCIQDIQDIRWKKSAD